ncbi:glycosyltransferase family 39 protein [Nonomuraea longicatena]|uniref:glycosyltransferase family 39 protein n=1 Tax=Nonomuraea longicatena TaxID=83682 RepID=UPI0031DC6D4A
MTSAATLARPAQQVPRTHTWLPWPVAVLTGGVALSGSGRASLNGDELATISAASRSLSGLWELAQHIDGHFLPYYLFMHLWLKFGDAELWLRLPSAIAIGVAAWFLTDLGSRLQRKVTGATAAGILAVLPSVSYYGAFARSYAFAAAAVVFAFWALHRALDNPRAGRWVVYGVAVALVCSTHLFAVLTVPAHLFLVRRAILARMFAALAAGSLPAVVLGLIGYGERHAISWIPQRGPEVLLKFPKMAAGAAEVGLLLFAAALVGAALLWRTRRAWALALLGWLVLPPVLLLAVSHLVTPVYVDRYLFVTAPALALLAAFAGSSLGRFGVGVAGTVLVAAGVLAFSTHLDVRDSNGRFEDFPGAIRRVHTETGDALIFGQSSVRAGFDYYAEGPLPVDVLRRGLEPDIGGFGFPERPDVARALEGHDRVWLVWRGAKTAKLPRVKAVQDAGFALTSSWHSAELPGLTVALFTRS